MLRLAGAVTTKEGVEWRREWVMRRLVCHYQQPVWPVFVSVGVKLGLVGVSGTVWNFREFSCFSFRFCFWGVGEVCGNPFGYLARDISCQVGARWGFR